MTDSFASDGTAQREGETQAAGELRALIGQLRELGPEETVGHVTSRRLISMDFKSKMKNKTQNYSFN